MFFSTSHLKGIAIKQGFILGMSLWKVTLKSQKIYNGSRFSQQDAAGVLDLWLQF